MFKSFGVHCTKILKFNFTANTACNSYNIRMCISHEVYVDKLIND